LGFFLCAYTHSLNYLYACFGGIGGLGNGFGYATPIPVMAKWFPDKRGLAVGLAVAGYGGGSALFGPLANLKLIPAYGVHTTFMILGVIFLFMTVIGAVVGAIGNAAGRILSGWMSDALGRLNVLRLMIAISMIAMPVLYNVGGNVAALYVVVFIVYWCYGTQLSVNASTTSDFWGTKNA